MLTYKKNHLVVSFWVHLTNKMYFLMHLMLNKKNWVSFFPLRSVCTHKKYQWPPYK